VTTAPAPPRPAARTEESLREVLERFEGEAAGAEMHELLRELFPLCRSLTGEGVRRTLAVLGRGLRMRTTEVPSGTRVFDWTVPPEWNLRSATLVAPDGEVVADAARSSLHVVGYSVPKDGVVSLDELQPHLHSLPEQPALVPYRTSYYKEDWGFCLSHERRARLQPGDYRVHIDATLGPGSLTYGEIVLPGASTREVLVSAHCCHPSLANDNLSGMVVATALARALAGARRRHTWRFLFAPATIGAITWLARNERRAPRIAHGLVLAGVGDPGPLTWKRTRRGDALVDRAAAHVLARSGRAHAVRDFEPYGYDERQYGSPGFDLPVGALSRTPYGEYPEYHTSADDPSFVRADQLADALRRCLEIAEILEGEGAYLNLSPRGEPQLGRRGLYGPVGGKGHAAVHQRALLWVLNLADGVHTLLDAAERAGLAFGDVRRAADELLIAGLLAPRDAGREAGA
jgi:aminopeptidase-like protein